MKHFLIILLTSLMLDQAFAATEIFIIQHPRNYIEAAQRDGLDVKSALERDVASTERFFLIVARTNDCWTNQVSSAMQRSLVIRSAANVITEASNSGTYFPVDKYVSQIKQKVLNESGGLEIPRTHYLAPVNAAPESPERNTSPVERSVVGTIKPEENKSGNSPLWKANLPQIIINTLLISILIILGVYIFISIKRKKYQRKELQYLKVEHLRQRVESKETEILRKFPELQAHFHLNILLLAITLSLFTSDSFCQKMFDVRALDVSGTYRSKLEEAKREIAISILSGNPVHIVIFGDSIRTLGRVRTIAQLDSVFNILGNDKNTRLSDAISWLMSYTDSLREKGFKPSVTVYSDFWNDDDGNEALSNGMIPSREASYSSWLDSSNKPVKTINTGNKSLADGFLYGVLLSIVLITIGWIAFFKHKKLSTQQYKTLEVFTGNQVRQFSVNQLHNRKLKIAPSFDADVRSGSSELLVETAQENGSLSISMQPTKDNREVIVLTLKKEKDHER